MTVAEIKEIKLLQSKKGRDESGLFIVEGEKMVAEAVKSGFETLAVYRSSEIGEKAMERISTLITPPGTLAVLRQKHYGVPKQFSGLSIALDGLRDPGNLGTIIRIADWYGIDTIYASPDTVEVYNPKVVQSTMGAIFRVKVIYTDIPALCKSVRAAGGSVFGTFLDPESENIYKADVSGSGARVIVIGNESNGIRPETAACVNRRFYIPPFPEDQRTSESLNAAVACGITVSEFRRREF